MIYYATHTDSYQEKPLSNFFNDNKNGVAYILKIKQESFMKKFLSIFKYERLFSKPTIRIEDVSKALNVSASTDGGLLNKLSNEDILKNLDNKKKDKVFVYQKYLDIFNQE